MTYDELLGLAFQYKKTRLWKKLWDNDLIAFRFSDGRTGYLSVMGKIGEEMALAVYTGDEGFQSLRDIANCEEHADNVLDYHEFMFRQTCLQCAFDNKEYVNAAQQDKVRIYAKEHGIRLAGAHAYPNLLKYEKNRVPWFVEDERDRQDLAEGLQAAIWTAEQLERQTASQLGILGVNLQEGEETGDIPLLIRDGDGYRMERTEAPRERKPVYAYPKADEKTVFRLKGAKKKGVLACRLIQMPASVKSEEGGAPYFPFFVLTVKKGVRDMIPVDLVRDPEDHPQEALEKFSAALQKAHFIPSAIEAADERTYGLLEDFAGKAGIRIRMERNVPELADAEHAFAEHFLEEPDEFEEEDGSGRRDDFGETGEGGEPEPDEEKDMLRGIVNMIMALPDNELKTMPAALQKEVEQIMDLYELPAEVVSKWKRVFHPANGGKVVDFRSRRRK